MSKRVKTYGKPKHFLDELIQKKNLSEEFRDFTIDNFLTFDIEVVQKNDSEEKLLTPISIGVGSTFDTDQYFERNSSLPEDGDLVVFEFLSSFRVFGRSTSLHRCEFVSSIGT